MPVPRPNNLTLGRSVVDANAIQDGDWEALRQALSKLEQTLVGGGSPSPALDGDDTVYQWVYTTYDSGEDEWTLWAGKPDDPLNPDEIPITGTGGGSVTAGLYIDVDGDEVSVDLTEIAEYDSGETQFLQHETGTFKWGSNSSSVDAGPGIIVGGTTVTWKPKAAEGLGFDDDDGSFAVAKISTATHLGFGSLGEIEIVWTGMTNWVSTDNRLLGHVASSSNIPQWDTIATWLSRVSGYGSGNLVLSTSGSVISWATPAVAVSAGLYIDIDAGQVSVDLTEVANYSGGSNQILKNNSGSIEWGPPPEAGGEGGTGALYWVTQKITAAVDGADGAFVDGHGLGIKLIESSNHNWEVDPESVEVEIRNSVGEEIPMGRRIQVKGIKGLGDATRLFVDVDACN